MRRLLTAIALTAFAATLAIVPMPASAKPDRDRDHDQGMHRRCPRGSHWVPPHRDRMGRWVPGHCKVR